MQKKIINRSLSEEQQTEYLKSIKDNMGYCPCRLSKVKCGQCNDYEDGVCYCGVFELVEVNN